MTDDIVTRLRHSLAVDPDIDADLTEEAADEIERLRRWKVEATAVLEGWDAVWECAGRGTLGESKQRGVIARLGELDDEIERLRAEVDLKGYRLDDALDKIKRLRAAGDALAEAHGPDMCDCDQSECIEIRNAHDAWQEARRG